MSLESYVHGDGGIHSTLDAARERRENVHKNGPGDYAPSSSHFVTHCVRPYQAVLAPKRFELEYTCTGITSAVPTTPTCGLGGRPFSDTSATVHTLH